MRNLTKVTGSFFIILLLSFFLNSCTSFQSAKKQYSYLNKVDAGTSDVQGIPFHRSSTVLATEHRLPAETLSHEQQFETNNTDHRALALDNGTQTQPKFKSVIPIKKNITDNFFKKAKSGSFLSASTSGGKFASHINPWTIIIWILVIALIATLLGMLNIDIWAILGIVILVLLILILIQYLSY